MDEIIGDLHQQIPGSHEELMGQKLAHGPELKESEAIAELHKVTDELLSEGVTLEEIDTLRKQAEAVIDNPQLSLPDQELIGQYLRRVSALALKLAKEEGEAPKEAGLPVGNKFLTGSMLVELFKILTDIARLESKIAFEQSQMKISMAKFMMAVAKDIAKLIIAMGDVAAKKCYLEAAKAFAEGIAAIAQIAVSVATIVITKYQHNTEVDKFKKGKTNELHKADIEAIKGNKEGKYLTDKQPTVSGTAGEAQAPPLEKAEIDPQLLPEKGKTYLWKKGAEEQFKKDITPSVKDDLKIWSKVQGNLKPIMDACTQGIQALKSMAEGAINIYRAHAEVEEAAYNAAKSILSQLLEMVNKFSADIGSDIQAVRSSIDKLLSLLESIMHTLSTIGEGKG